MLGFLVKTYPKISETFVLQEILELQKEAFAVEIFSLQQPTDMNFHRAFDQVTAKVNDLSFRNKAGWQKLGIHVWFMFNRLWPYLTTLKFTFSRFEKGSFDDFCQAVYFAGLVQKKKIRHIHAHFASEPSALAELTSRLCGISYSISAHAKDIYLQNTASLSRKMANAEFVVTCTGYNQRYLQSINQSNTPVYKLYHGIDCARLQAENTRTNCLTAMPYILSVGRLREKKGFTTLISACRLLKQEGYHFQCDIVGYGPDHETLKQLIGQYQLSDSVRLLGKLTHPELIALYRNTRIFTLPCQIAEDGDRDGIPNVLMEAMSFAIPVVSTDISGIPELIEHERSGLICQPNDERALFDCLKRLLDDPRLRSQLGQAGQQRVISKFSVHQHITQLKQLLSQVLQIPVENNINTTLSGERHG